MRNRETKGAQAMIKIRFVMGKRDPARARQEAVDELAGLDDALARGIARCEATLNRALERANLTDALQFRLHLESLLQEGRAAHNTRTSAQNLLASGGSAEAEPPVQPGSESDATHYWISSETLANAHAHLTQHLSERGEDPEWILAVTGLSIGSVRTLETLIEVRMESQASAQASLDMRDFTKVAVTLMEHGQALHGVFHSHRFRGQPQPSSTDLRLQSILEEGGYPAVQAVFSEDGYVRFFAQRRPFAIEVCGKGVERVEDYVFRINQRGTLPHPAIASPDARRGTGIRPLFAHSRR